MSFILDALRKSENERQRGAVPGIAHVPYAAPRETLPKWVLAVIGGLAVTVLALAAAWWDSAQDSPAADIAASRPTVTVPIDLPPAAPATPVFAPSGESLPRVEQPLQAIAGARPAASPERASAPAEPESPAPAAESAETLPSAAALAAEGIALPELVLELHVFYRDRPSDRFVIINGKRYREGDSLPEGPRVDAIDTFGAIMSYRDRRFLLTPE